MRGRGEEQRRGSAHGAHGDGQRLCLSQSMEWMSVVDFIVTGLWARARVTHMTRMKGFHQRKESIVGRGGETGPAAELTVRTQYAVSIDRVDQDPPRAPRSQF